MNQFVLLVRDECDDYGHQHESAYPLETPLSKAEVEDSFLEMAKDARYCRGRLYASTIYKLDGCRREFSPWSLLDEYRQPQPPKVLTLDEWFCGEQ